MIGGFVLPNEWKLITCNALCLLIVIVCNYITYDKFDYGATDIVCAYSKRSGKKKNKTKSFTNELEELNENA